MLLVERICILPPPQFKKSKQKRMCNAFTLADSSGMIVKSESCKFALRYH